jgi:hypothetical protein
MKIIAKTEYEFKWVSIWVGNFESHDELQARAEAVLMPQVGGEDGYDFEGLAEWTTRESGPCHLSEMMGNDFMWTIYDVPPVLAAADALGVGKVNGFIQFNHTRCTAGPHDFPGFTFLGTFPCWANPEMEEDAD